MTDTLYAPIHSMDTTPATLEDFRSIDLAEFNRFSNNYPARVMEFMALADKIADSRFSDSLISGHIQVDIPSLNINLHLPFVLKCANVAEAITTAIMHDKIQLATQRIEVRLFFEAEQQKKREADQAAAVAAEAVAQEPDANCVIAPDGGCIGTGPCMHDVPPTEEVWGGCSGQPMLGAAGSISEGTSGMYAEGADVGASPNAVN